MKYYIGLDGHSKTCVFVVMNKEGKILKKDRVITSEKSLLQYLRGIEGKKSLVFEETTMAQWFYLLFKDEVDEIVVCNPIYAGKRRGAKNDFKDAISLADGLRTKSDRIVPVHHEDSEFWQLRSTVSSYFDVVKDSTRTKNRYKALFRANCIETRGSTIYSDKERIKLLPTSYDQFVAEHVYKQLEIQKEVNKAYDLKFEEFAKKFSEIKRLCSIPGLGPIRSSTIVALVCSPDRFHDKHKFWSYCMLIKYVDESDGVIYGKRKAFGRRELKNVFIGAAESVLMHSDSSLRKYYDRLRSKGVTHKNARKAVARRIASISLAILKKGVKFDDKYEEKLKRANKKI